MIYMISYGDCFLHRSCAGPKADGRDLVPAAQGLSQVPRFRDPPLGTSALTGA